MSGELKQFQRSMGNKRCFRCGSPAVAIHQGCYACRECLKDIKEIGRKNKRSRL